MTKQDLIGRKFRVQATGVVYQFMDDPQADKIKIGNFQSNKQYKDIQKGCWLVKSVLENLQDTDELRWELLEEHVVEVGDVYISKKYSQHGNKVVKSIYQNNVNWEDRDFDHLDTLLDLFTLVSKADKQEVIGYELLKDLPGIPAGTKSLYIKVTNSYSFSCGIVSNTFSPEQTKDTTWFKPIYKAREVVVKISGGREVTIAGDKLSIENGAEFCNKQQLQDLRLYISREYKLQTGRKAYAVEIATFRLGCQEFTKHDIELIYKIIQNIK